MALTSLVMLELVGVYMVRKDYHVKMFSNPWLVAALASSFFLQLIIIYVPFFQAIFDVVPLTVNEWGVILTVMIAAWILTDLTRKLLQRIIF